MWSRRNQLWLHTTWRYTTIAMIKRVMVSKPRLEQLSHCMKRTINLVSLLTNEPQHDKTNKVAVCIAKTQISLSIRPVWSESLLSAWRKLRSLATHWAHSEDSDQTGRMPRLIWVFAGCTVILLVLSWGHSNHVNANDKSFLIPGSSYSHWISKSRKALHNMRNAIFLR